MFRLIQFKQYVEDLYKWISPGYAEKIGLFIYVLSSLNNHTNNCFSKIFDFEFFDTVTNQVKIDKLL